MSVTLLLPGLHMGEGRQLYLAPAELISGQRDWNNKVGFVPALPGSSVYYGLGKGIGYPNPVGY